MEIFLNPYIPGPQFHNDHSSNTGHLSLSTLANHKNVFRLYLIVLFFHHYVWSLKKKVSPCFLVVLLKNTVEASKRSYRTEKL